MAKDLAQRTQAAAAQQRDDNGQQPPTIDRLIERQKAEIARALPKHLDPDRLARIALTVFRQTPQLARCDPKSFLGALMTCSQLGLEPGPLGEAYLVPYGQQVTFIPGYRGLIKLAWQSGQLKNIAAHVVHEGDEFDYAYGLEPYLRHKPALTGAGRVIAVYASAVLNNGGSAFIVMSTDDVEAIRKRSRSGQNGPWKTDWDAMARKTAVRQLIRWLPLSTELAPLATAAQYDETVRADADLTRPLEETTPQYLDAPDEAVAITGGEPVDAEPVDAEPIDEGADEMAELDAEREAGEQP